MEQICGNCKWHEHESIDDGWEYVNADSEYCTDWTNHDHSCEDWEGRE